MNLLVIGGSDAGISAALRARELDGSAKITVLLADSFPNYSICGFASTVVWKPMFPEFTLQEIALRPGIAF
jgi:NADPH-dependent 2,4-dienoyl-CoA reductase/sulfur reductase-like enzyme